ncbi:MAG: PQQ-binding-like beta-propeller repeat protein [Candidatus Omnitrophica bacterium]|nr:PQQ-binding-like beta-propeller repeat protein [Candidatus Omnitrophota bacterium]
MMSLIRNIVFFITLSFMICLIGISESKKPLPDWPNCVAYNFTPPGSGISLTKDKKQIKKTWSVPIHTGIGKNSFSAVRDVIEQGFEPTIGDSASPIVYDKVLLVSWTQSSGEIIANPETLTDRYFFNRPELSNPKVRNTYLRIDADWITVALDAYTGKELWRQIEKSASLNFQSSKRGHNGISGAAENGIYVTVSILGHVFAYEISTGKRLWHNTLPKWHPFAQKYKEKCISERRLPPLREQIGYKRSGVMIVGEIAVVPDLYRGIIGFDLKTGKMLWREKNLLDDATTPRPWKDEEGKTWLILKNSTSRYGPCEISLIEPKTGEKKWLHKTGINPGELNMGEGHILLNTETDGKKVGLWTCYLITINGLVEKWKMPDKPEYRFWIAPDSGPRRRAIIHDGVVYAMLGDYEDKEKNLRVPGRLYSFSLKDGRKLCVDENSEIRGWMPVIIEDMLYLQTDPSHSGNGAGLLMYQISKNGIFSKVGKVDFIGDLELLIITDYEHPIEFPYAYGMHFVRALNKIAAIDLRQ